MGNFKRGKTWQYKRNNEHIKGERVL